MPPFIFFMGPLNILGDVCVFIVTSASASSYHCTIIACLIRIDYNNSTGKEAVTILPK